MDKILSKVLGDVNGNLVFECGPGKLKWNVNGLKDYLRKWKYIAKYNVDREVTNDCIIRVVSCSWWSLKGESRPFFLRWPEDCYISSRGGRKTLSKENYQRMEFLSNQLKRSLEIEYG